MAFGKRRAAFVAAGLAVLLSASTACGTAGPGDTSGSGATAWALTGPDQEIVTASMKNWSDAHQDAALTPQFYANDAYKQKIRTAIGAGKAPTLITGWGGGNLKSWVGAHKVVDLTDKLGGKQALDKKFVPSVVDTGTVDGKVYGVPYNGTQPVVLYYNKALFDKVGASPPKTWQDLMALVPKFRNAGVAPIAIGGQSKWPLLMWEEYLIGRIGGPGVFDAIANNEPGAWSDPAVLEANKKLRKLVDAGGFVDGFSSISTDSNADTALLYTGKAAMYLMGSWAYPTIKDAAPKFISQGKLGYTTFPTVKGGKGNRANIVGNPANFWSVSADASKKAQDAAAKYLDKGLMSGPYVDRLLKKGSVPPVQGIKDKVTKAAHGGKYLPWIYDLVRNAPSFQLSWDQALDPGQAQHLLNNLGKLFLKQISPKQFSVNMDKTIEQ